MVNRAKNPLTGCTPQQDHAAYLVALHGLSQSDAYRQAYHLSLSILPQTVWSDANRLFALPHVKARVAALRASLEAMQLTDAAEILQELRTVGMVAVAKTGVRPADKVAALDKMAKILGLYQDKSEVMNRPVAITQITVVLDHGGRQIEDSRFIGAIVEQVKTVPTEEPELAPSMGEGAEAPQIGS